MELRVHQDAQVFVIEAPHEAVVDYIECEGMLIEGVILPRKGRRAYWLPSAFLVTMAEDGDHGLKIVSVESETTPEC